MSSLRNIYWKIWGWFYYDSPVFISFNPFECIKTWMKVFGVFKFPHMKATKINRKIWHVNHMMKKIVALVSYDVQWKDKYSSPRHERNPYLLVNLFGYGFYISFGYDGEGLFGSFEDMLYWEAIIDYCNFKDKNLFYTLVDNMWDSDHSNDPKHGTILPMITKRAYAKLLAEKKDEIEGILERRNNH